MSCVSPISLLNPTLHYIEGVDKVICDVPCGKCYACREQNKTDWFIRCYYECLRTKAIGGATYMFTLTYNNDCLPKFGQFLTISELEDVKCFNKYDLQFFLDKLRHILRRKYKITGIKYLICSEYGEHTQRPHYHLCLHLPEKIYPSVLLKVIKRSWNFGFVYLSRNKQTGSGYVNGIFAPKYVAKYICKDLSYIEMPVLKKYIDDDEYKLALKPFMPFHLQSKGYGSNICDIVKSDPLKYFNEGIFIPIVNKHYNLPRYVINKLCYSYRCEDNSRYLNEFGKKVKALQYDKIISKKTEQLKVDFTHLGISRYVNNIAYFNKAGGIPIHSNLLNICNVDRIFTELNELLAGRSVKLLAIYSLFFRNRVCKNYRYYMLCAQENDTLFSKLKHDYFDMLSQHFGDIYVNNQLTHRYMKERHFYYNEAPIFRDFDRILTIINGLRNDFNICKNKYKLRKDIIVEKLRQRYI